LESEDLRDYVGLGWQAPFLGTVMAIFLFSLTGLPPTGGFVSEYPDLVYYESYIRNSRMSLVFFKIILRRDERERIENQNSGLDDGGSGDAG